SDLQVHGRRDPELQPLSEPPRHLLHGKILTKRERGRESDPSPFSACLLRQLVVATALMYSSRTHRAYAPRSAAKYCAHRALWNLAACPSMPRGNRPSNY